MASKYRHRIVSAASFTGMAALTSFVIVNLLNGSTLSDAAVEQNDWEIKESVRALLANGKTEIPSGMTADAKAVVEDYDWVAEEIRRKAAREIREHRLRAMRRLKELQDVHTRATQLDEAVAIRDTIRNMIEAGFQSIDNPGSMHAYANQIGRSLLMRVTGRTGGSVYGSTYYTYDSDIATACVHAGVLRVGETGVVVVTMISAREPHVGSIQNGVRSYDYGVYPASYTVRRWKPTAEEIELGSLRSEGAVLQPSRLPPVENE